MTDAPTITPAAVPPAGVEPSVAQERKDLLFAVRRSLRYHRSRARFFENVEVTSDALDLLFGSAAIVAILKNLPPGWVIALAAVVSATAALRIALQVSRKSSTHAALAREFARLEMDIRRDEAPTAAAVREWWGRRLDIEADEPPVKEVLNLIMHNRVCLSMRESKRSDCYEIKWFRRLTAHFLNLSADNIQPMKEIPARRHAELPTGASEQ